MGRRTQAYTMGSVCKAYTYQGSAPQHVKGFAGKAHVSLKGYDGEASTCQRCIPTYQRLLVFMISLILLLSPLNYLSSFFFYSHPGVLFLAQA